MEDIKTYLKELTSLSGVSSREDNVIRYMHSHLSKYSDDLVVDTLGNIICHFPSAKPNSKRIMIFAHMDEIGFIIRRVEEDGFLRVERVGGVNVNVIAGLRVDVLGDKGVVPGLVGTKSYHFLKPNERGTVPATEELYIDIGVQSRTQAEEIGVHAGCFITYHSEFTELQSGFIANKAIDNRVGCTVLLKLAESLANQILEWDVYLVACVQEEFSIRGLLPAVRRIHPDVSIGVDVTPSCDTPDLKNYAEVVMNGGPALTYLNYHGRGTLAGVLPDKALLDALIDTCTREAIPYQREISVGVITENGFVLFEELGVAVANVSVPTRYTHSPIEMISIRDVAQTCELLSKFVTGLTHGAQFGKSHLNFG